MKKTAARQTLRTVILRWKRDFRGKRELRAELATYDEAFAAIDALSTREDAMTLAARVAQLGLGPREFEEMASHWYRCRRPGSAWPERAEVPRDGEHGTRSQSINGELWYPRQEGEPDFILVSLCDVRAADDLVVSYDFNRDGWSITLLEQHDVELSFIPAWGDKT